MGMGRPTRQPGLAQNIAAVRHPNPNLELYILRGFLPPHDCAELVTRIDANCRPSTIADDDGTDPYYRTSSTCDLDGTDPLVASVNWRLSMVMGIDPALGEPLQGQRYLVGQEFKAHTDYFEPNGRDYDLHCATAGQRTWTVMVYLNETEEGGATRFTHLKEEIRPQVGVALAWNNQTPQDAPNPWTLHHGTPVLKGTKYIITKWFRERPWG
jgi:prolyl 4-hydroxylase